MSDSDNLKLNQELPDGNVVGDNNLLTRFSTGLSKTKNLLWHSVSKPFTSREDFENEFLPKLEEKLILADVGYQTADKVAKQILQKHRAGAIKSEADAMAEVAAIFKQIISGNQAKLQLASNSPTVIFFMGVNGAGKTSSVGKLAYQLKQAGHSVLMAAADTFRAAASEQLLKWGADSAIRVHHKESGADPAAVIYESLRLGIDEKYDFILCDTSGRLHNKKPLIDELAKMQRVAKKLIADAPHYNLLVLDGNSSQNAISQTREFLQATAINGLIITKLDGSAKGGIVLSLVNEFKLPVFYVGLGEKFGDLVEFNARDYLASILT